jgi:two-component system LytT family response regulator
MDFCLRDGSAIDVFTLTNSKSYENAILFLKEKDEILEKLLKANSFNYLVKPFDSNHLVLHFNALLKKDTVFNNNFQNNKNIEPSQSLKNRIPISDSKGYRFLDVFKIVRCEINDNCLSFMMSDGMVNKCINTMKWAENILSGSDCIFLRVHNKHLINVDYLSNYSKNNHNKVEMTDQSIVPVSARKRNTVIKFIKKQVNFIKSFLIIFSSQLLLFISDQF